MVHGGFHYQPVFQDYAKHSKLSVRPEKYFAIQSIMSSLYPASSNADNSVSVIFLVDSTNNRSTAHS
jgi:hypothetical protein